MSVTVEDFLEHHGVKGQHWGIRNVKQEAHDLKTKFKKNKKLKTGLKIVGGVAAVAAVATGAIVADRLIRQHSTMKATDLTKLWSKGKPWLVPPVSSATMKTPVSALPKEAFSKSDLSLYKPKALKELKARVEKTALKPGAKIPSFAPAIAPLLAKSPKSGVKKSTGAQILKSLGSVRVSVK